MHKTKNLDDGYMGSGKHLKRAIAKYGQSNFSKEILHVFDNEEDMIQKEKEIVTLDFLSRSDVYNICEGGKGGFSHINSNSELVAKRDTKENKRKGYEAANLSKYNVGRKATEETKKKISDAAKRRDTPNSFLGKHHTPEHNAYMSKIMSEKYKGSGNPQFGTMWITNGVENKKIKKSSEPLPDGWYKGRTMK